jgi:glycosyltransferase involved in cell wall biosynthesis
MSDDILISFIVPVYNTEKTISKCLDSLINQTIKNFEIIVVNDGTRDNAQILIDNYYKKYQLFHD